MTLTFELDLNSVKTYQRSKYLGQRSFSSNVIALTPNDTHTSGRLLYVGHWSANDLGLTIKPRLHDTTYRLTTGCIVYTNIQPVVKPVWQPHWQQTVSCIQPVVKPGSNPVWQPNRI